MQHSIDGYWHNLTVTGVPVTLLAIDTNGNAIDIGKATSDMSGNYKMEWTPSTESLYKITATFAGSNSYGSSWAETGLSVGPAPVIPENTDRQPSDIGRYISKFFLHGNRSGHYCHNTRSSHSGSTVAKKAAVLTPIPFFVRF